MKVQELLDALTKAQNETDLNPVAVWAISIYLGEAWKDVPERDIRPYNLGKAMSDFFVDLSQKRLPAKIIAQTPQTESILMEIFGANEGGLTTFWTQCIAIWGLTLQQELDYSKEVKEYFDLLLSSSQRNRSGGTQLQVAEPSPLIIPESEESLPKVSPPVATNFNESQPELAEESSVPVSSGSEDKPLQVETSSQIEVSDNPDTPAAKVESAVETELEPNKLPRNAYLILQGTRVIPLSQPFIKIGRQLDNHIILEDPRVSRSHAQLKLINDRFVIFDMHSTGGTFVNGKRTDQSVLFPGDVVSLAGVVFIYSQELPAKTGEVKVIELGSKFAADRPTAVMHGEELKEAEKVERKDLPDLPKTGPLQK